MKLGCLAHSELGEDARLLQQIIQSFVRLDALRAVQSVVLFPQRFLLLLSRALLLGRLSSFLLLGLLSALRLLRVGVLLSLSFAPSPLVLLRLAVALHHAAGAALGRFQLLRGIEANC